MNRACCLLTFGVVVGLLGMPLDAVFSQPASDGSEAGTVPPEHDSLSLAPFLELMEDGKFSDAEAVARELLRKRKTEYGEVSAEVADVLKKLAECMWRGGKGSDAETLECAERAVAIDEEIYGPDHERVGLDLVELGNVLDSRGDQQGARRQWERALAIFDERLDKDHGWRIAALHNLGGVCNRTGDLEAAKGYYSEALDAAESAFGVESPEFASTLSTVSTTYLYSGDAEEARRLLEKALAIQEATLGPEDLSLAHTCNDLGLLLTEMGEFSDAQELLQRSLKIRENVLGPDHPNVGNSLVNLAILEGSMGMARRAYSHVDRAIAIAEKANGPEHMNVGVALAIAAMGRQGFGDLAGARAYNQRALAIFEVSLGPAHPRVGWVLGNLGTVLFQMGDYDGAKDYYMRSLENLGASFGEENRYYTGALLNLAEVSEATGEIDEAKAYCQRALQIDESVWGPDSLDVANVLLLLSSLHRTEGSFDEAERECRRAVWIKEQKFDHDSVAVAKSKICIGDLSCDRGDFAEARELYGSVASTLESEVGPGHPDMASILLKKAETELALGELGSAFDDAVRANAISRDQLRLTLPALSEREALTFAASNRSALDALLSTFHMDEQQEVERAWDAVIRSRGLVLDEMGTRHRAAAHGDRPDVNRLAEDLAAARSRIAFLTVAGPDDTNPAVWKEMMDEAGRDKEQLERKLSEASVSFRRQEDQSRAGLHQVSEAMPTGTSLVAYVRHDRLMAGSAGRTDVGPKQTQSHYTAFVLSPSKSPAVVPLGPAEAVDGMLALTRDNVVAEGIAGRRSTWRAEREFWETGTSLRRAVWDPIAPHVRGAKAVIVVPDGALNLVDLATLPVDDDRYLIETGPRFHYLGAERDLVELPAGVPPGAMLAVGNPDFDEPEVFASLAETEPIAVEHRMMKFASLSTFRGQRATCASFREMEFDSLPASEVEVAEVVTVWNESAGEVRTRGGSAQAATVYTMTGGEATERAFKEMAPQSNLLHLATHGFFLGGECAEALGQEGDETFRLQSENPLVLSGLALAGANLRSAAGPDEEDGILTAEEIASLDLSGVEWAVLSACDTGVGEVTAGEGVFGLRRAFQVAGARTLIMSLWPVDDEVTRAWMRELYTNRFTNGMSTIDSVHEASLALLEERREKGLSTHPFYWAGFIASGDWR